MMGFILVGIAILSSASAQAGAVVPIPGCEQLDEANGYFPRGVFKQSEDDDRRDVHRRSRYSTFLRAMSEPSFYCTRQSAEAYRFLWLRTRGRPIAIRVSVVAGLATIHAVEMDGAGGYHPGKESRRLERKLKPSEWKEIVDGLLSMDFWKMPPTAQKSGHDGAHWILEGRKGADYHVVDRWEPESGPYHDLCLKLVGLAGF
jgi:hypothetical protein